MALKLESYMALLAVTFAFVMVQMQITVDGQYRVRTNTTNTTYTTNTTNTTNTSNGRNKTETGVTTSTGVTGAGSGVTGNGITGPGTGVYTGMASYTSSSTSSSKTGCFQMLQHVLMALSFLQVIQ
ncbi:hypothetical protein E1301_Tti000186 [Triplophysa tibetana]|uniref:Uncharacterized protein n=1 Tax=Triplophysa tibetana TaxID=1572043 RepID=A0A5A9N4C5_9TELE|nr:hypothetical protein E1301_Tti000186 [Triplophysa tibetana]